ncbi:hypothetical protein OBK24_13295, partial [Empedobacter falsenii]
KQYEKQLRNILTKFQSRLNPAFCKTHVLVAQLKNKKKFRSCSMQGRKEFTPQLFYELSLERLVQPITFIAV